MSKRKLPIDPPPLCGQFLDDDDSDILSNLSLEELFDEPTTESKRVALDLIELTGDLEEIPDEPILSEAGPGYAVYAVGEIFNGAEIPWLGHEDGYYIIDEPEETLLEKTAKLVERAVVDRDKDATKQLRQMVKDGNHKWIVERIKKVLNNLPKLRARYRRPRIVSPSRPTCGQSPADMRASAGRDTLPLER